MQSEIANKGRVRRWPVYVASNGRLQDGSRLTSWAKEHYTIEVLEAAPLKNLLTELADTLTERARKARNEAEAQWHRGRLRADYCDGQGMAWENAASELRHLITEQLGGER
jgi:hypothetical protein